MRLEKYLHIILLFFVCLSANKVYTQESNEVSKAEFKKFNDQLDYDKTSEKLRWKKSKPKKKKKKEPKERSNTDFGFGGLGGIFKVIAYLLIGVLIIGIVYVIFSNVQLDQDLPNREITEINLEEEHIEDVDVESELERALRLGDYRMALRMRFLLVLQQLSVNKDIDWKFEKTNRDYSTELMGTPLFSGFKTISGVFEWVWYGNNQIDEHEYNHYSVAFNQFNTPIE